LEKLDKMTQPRSNTIKSEANASNNDDTDEYDSTAFMVHSMNIDSDDSWYIDGGAIEHMTNRLDWFDSFNEILQGHWPVIIADNRRFWMRGVDNIKI
jgi:hypothetical protein